MLRVRDAFNEIADKMPRRGSCNDARRRDLEQIESFPRVWRQPRLKPGAPFFRCKGR
jgi:hypothetical protein